MSDARPIEARGLTKVYGERRAVDGVDVTVEAGDVYGYLGPNGAGKTTSLRMMLGLIRPTEGQALLFGKDPLTAGARALDGVAGFVEAPRFYPYLTARKNLELLAAFDGGDARTVIDEALDAVDLADRAGDRVGGYSHGMKQRLGIAAALLRRPRLLILDEPTTGLDPAGMRDMRDLVRRLASDGLTVLLSSHLMAEVEELCNRVAIIRTGTILYEGQLDALLRSHGQSRRLRVTDPQRALQLGLKRGLTLRRSEGDGLELEADDEDVTAFTVALGAAGVGIRELTTGRASLEHLFFELTEGGAEEQGDAAPAEQVAVA
ncbi:MAG TPA: ABC transporter ATP-binding protein [Gaiellales bacterium]|nr:ABC transporter ATP-binding protein [Gaiellales bacterium]